MLSVSSRSTNTDAAKIETSALQFLGDFANIDVMWRFSSNSAAFFRKEWRDRLVGARHFRFCGYGCLSLAPLPFLRQLDL
jgi:hypothetical protein